ncbi:FkbM family methyltransferase [Sulfolobus sp. E11-6]|uniref:FkbM family methyltransferase n=1 Tax=Sulfolobus sp. E11-6 TaxID=2663020 RepID=UPI001297B593|nr:FkbM family methyltransferase [Sulfolobus sp. E11-6]QGA68535.1 FkbM family methyltransferase [Sulfolobus sp. E11-6]
MNLHLILSLLLRKNGIHNSLAYLLKRKGYFITKEGYKLKFNETNKKDVFQLLLLNLFHGVVFQDKEGYWRVDSEKGIVILPNGLKFKIRNFDSLIFAETFLYDIHYDNNLNGKIVVQGGGFIGDTALYYASKGAIVYSFEPDPISFNIALENISLNPELSKRITMINYAIGRDGMVKFPVNPAGSGPSSIYHTEGMKTIEVRSVSISTILKEFDISEPYLLDLDIKGAEFDVIDDPSVSKFHKVRIEYSSILVGKDRNILINKLKEYGFKEIRIYKHNCGIYDLHDHGVIEAIKE